MKKFKKKLMVIPFIASSLFATTACSSNIKFNQDDLDAVMNEAQQYLESQNNYSTEFAKNYLTHILATGREKVSNINSDLFLTAYIEEYDAIGNMLTSATQTVRSYKNGTTRKGHFKAVVNGGATVYEEYNIIDLTKTDNERNYDIKLYDVATKKYKQSNYIIDSDDEVSRTLTEDEEWSIKQTTLDMGVFYDSIYSTILEDSSVQITMDVMDNNKVAFYLSVWDEDFKQREYSKYVFENDVIVEMNIWNSASEEDRYETISKVNYTIEYDKGDFDIPNISSYTKVN